MKNSNMTDSQYIDLRQLTKSLINISKTQGEELTQGKLDAYINEAVALSKLKCDESTKTRLFIDLEYEYKIVHNKGQAIFNDYDEKRDWYSKMEIKDNFFWSRYKYFLINHSSISRVSINRLDDDTLPDIMNCLGNPNDILKTPRFRRGLIIGDVQSGKTATYTGLICKAADAGYKVVILLTGITENLRRQTQERIDEGIVGISLKKEGKYERRLLVGVGLDNKGIKASSITSTLNDFVGNCNKITMSLASTSLVLLVIKKNVSVLERLYDWLREQNIDPIKGYVDVPMLLIDDEADNASVNTRKEETDPTRTNKLIRQICNLFMNSTYVGFTATPFANVFIDPDSVDSMQHADLFPEHFIYALESPTNYVGADKIFYPEGTYYGNLRFISDIIEPDYSSEEYRDLLQKDPDTLNKGPFYYKHKKEWDGTLPDSLHESILCFCIANAVRDARGQGREPRSMLINMSRFIRVQKVITEHVAEWFEEIYNDVRVNFNDDSKRNENLRLYVELRAVWEKHFSQVKDIPFERVIKKSTLLKAMEKIEVKMVNGSKQSSSLNYKENPSLRVIAVGGLALSRGLTLEGLMVSYFYRNTATFDVLMQMGRWFGYRRGYEDIFQIWTSQTSALWYAEVARASIELKNDIKEMFEQRLTPKNFGIKVRDNCDELQITASNKMRTAASIEMRYSFYGNIYDTPYVTYNVEHNRRNLEQVKLLVSKLFHDGFKLHYTDFRKSAKDVNDTNDDSSRYFSDVPKSIIKGFIQNIKCSMANPSFDVKNIIDFLSNDNNPGIEKWDVAFENGNSDLCYDFDGLRMVHRMKRSVSESNRNIIQLSARRRVLTGSKEGRFALQKDDIVNAEERCKDVWRERNEDFEGRQIPLKAFFEYLPDRKPILIIMLIEPTISEVNNDNNTRIRKYIDSLAGDGIVAFAIGCPGIKAKGETVTYQVNKVFQHLNIEGEEPEEVDDEE